jgi:L,D-peptidoglycan transpeptidase YkuD (ErfK/YbiS/YcfS/YnhG family)
MRRVNCSQIAGLARSLVVAMLCVSCASSFAATSGETTSRGAKQLVLVITSDWNANQGTLSTYSRADGKWQVRDRAVAVSIGHDGAAWGTGLHEPQAGLQKREGDGRSPAGMFAIEQAFGYAPAFDSGLGYVGMTAGDYCIDVSDSVHYNTIVTERVAGRAAIERSTEPMRRDIHANGDRRYEWGFVIAHNPRAVREGGSCIFAHVWGAPGQTTAGCTAMNKSTMRELIRWLRADARPIFVLLPQAQYVRLRSAWQLPDVPR